MSKKLPEFYVSRAGHVKVIVLGCKTIGGETCVFPFKLNIEGKNKEVGPILYVQIYQLLIIRFYNINQSYKM